MLKKIMIWLKGYLIVRIKGSSVERFINLCINNNINIWDISDNNNYKTLHISKKSYNELEQYIEKTGVTIEITDKKGLPFLFYRYKKRKLFLLGLIIFISLIYSFSFFIWDINISGEDIYTDEQIIKKLEEYDIGIGSPKAKIDCSKLEKALRDDFEDIAWISCELKGTRLNISINETILPEKIEENDTPCNIIAVKDGLISDIYIESGTKVRSKGDEVKKGDILITGVINLYNDYDELIETSYVPANGKVYALVNYDYYDSFSMSYYEKQYTGKTKKYYGLVIADNTFEPYKPKAGYNNYDLIENDTKLKLGTFFYLPLSLKKCSINEYEPVLMTYSINEAENKARVKLNKYIEDLNKKGVEILENNVKIEISGDTCIAQGNLVTKELIGIPEDITIINQGEDNTDGVY